jgi:Flp pilus assembly protein TadD
MRVLRFLPFLLILPAGSALIADNSPNVAPQVPSQSLVLKEKEQELESLFAQLRRTETLEAAQKIEADIFIRLAQSSSPTINSLMEIAAEAQQTGDEAFARKTLADVANLAPDFAEGLTRCAAADYAAGDLDRAERRLRQALRAEPRHFAAWTGLALVLEDRGDLVGARKAYEEALFLHPLLDAAKRGLIRVEAKSTGLSL